MGRKEAAHTWGVVRGKAVAAERRGRGKVGEVCSVESFRTDWQASRKRAQARSPGRNLI